MDLPSAAAPWKTSTFCSSDGCVQARRDGHGGMQVRDGKAGDASPVLTFTGPEWDAFLAGVKAGEFSQ
jgi:hypothetical protein